MTENKLRRISISLTVQCCEWRQQWNKVRLTKISPSCFSHIHVMSGKVFSFAWQENKQMCLIMVFFYSCICWLGLFGLLCIQHLSPVTGFFFFFSVFYSKRGAKTLLQCLCPHTALHQWHCCSDVCRSAVLNSPKFTCFFYERYHMSVWYMLAYIQTFWIVFSKVVAFLCSHMFGNSVSTCSCHREGDTLHFSSRLIFMRYGKTRIALGSRNGEWDPWQRCRAWQVIMTGAWGICSSVLTPFHFPLTNWCSDIHRVIFHIPLLSETIWNHQVDLCRPFFEPTSLLNRTHSPSTAPADLDLVPTLFFHVYTLVLNSSLFPITHFYVTQ